MKKRWAVLVGGLCIAAAIFSGCGTEPLPADVPAPALELTSGWTMRDGLHYYLDESGNPLTGWQEIEGNTYYFLEYGDMATGWLELDGKLYYLRGDGIRVTGWLSLDGHRYYMGPDGAAVTGVREIDGKAYLFGPEGLMTGWATIGGQRYYADPNGHPLTGWQEIDGTLYFFQSTGVNHTGWLQQEGFTYYLTDSGAARGRMEIDGQTCYFAFNGQLIVLVNPWHIMPEDYDVTLADAGNKHKVADYALADLEEMMQACRDAGYRPAICSSYRTMEYQTGLYERKVNFYLDQDYELEEARKLAGTVVAYPGTSEHQLGLALDLVDNSNWSLDESQAKTPTQQWLMENSWRYGWILRYPDGSSESTGIIYEPWHYRYVGKDVAADIHASGLCLEDYLESLTA